MSIQQARGYLSKFGYADKIREFDVSSATVPLAALALGCEEGRIAKTLSFKIEDRCILIVAAGYAKIDNAKYKAQFHTKAKMLAVDEVEPMTGHAVGGVCPFGVKEGVEIYLDCSLRRYKTVFPACGSANSAIELTIEELEKLSGHAGWIDVCKAGEGT